MKVILLQDVKGTGKKGQVIDVSDGHAINFLLPRKLAAEATKGNMADLDAKQKQAEHKVVREVQLAQNLADKINGKSLRLAVRVGENGKMFGSVSNKEIAEALQTQADIAVDKKKIVLNEPVKAVGQYKAIVKLHAQVQATVTFDVVAAE
jgi:large subunit ribosomal protein L9